jgi:hypothetical protein
MDYHCSAQRQHVIQDNAFLMFMNVFPIRQMVNYSRQISPVLLTRFVKRQFDWSSKGHMNETIDRNALDLYSRHIRKGEQ